MIKAHCSVCGQAFSGPIIYEIKTMRFWMVFCSSECDRKFFEALPGSAEYIPPKLDPIDNRFEILDL